MNKTLDIGDPRWPAHAHCVYCNLTFHGLYIERVDADLKTHRASTGCYGNIPPAKRPKKKQVLV